MWSLQVLGPVRLAQEGSAPLRLGRKGEAVLACIAAHRGRVARSELVDRFWADRDAVQARNALRQWLFQLRRAVGPEDFLAVDGEHIAIDAARCHVDLWRFVDCAHGAEPAAWREAASLYRHEFAQGLDGHGAWVQGERERCRALAGRVLGRLATLADASGAQDALDLGRTLLEQDGLDEATYRAMMTLYARLGMRAKAISLWHECRRALRIEVGTEPSRETREAFERVDRGGESAVLAVVQPIRPVRGHARPPPLHRDREEAHAAARDHVLRGTHHYFTGSAEDNARARDAYHMAAMIAPDLVEPAMCGAWTYFTDFQFGWNGDPDRNLAHCVQLADAMMRREPDHPLVLALWGRVSLWQHDYRGAVEAFSRSARLRPQDAPVLANTADALMRTGRADEAAGLVQRALELDPANRGVLHSVQGAVRFALGDLEGAHEAFQTAVRRNPGLCSAHGGLAAALAEMGDLESAREAAWNGRRTGNMRMSVDFVRGVAPFAEPALRSRWVRAWELAEVPQREPRLRPLAA